MKVILSQRYLFSNKKIIQAQKIIDISDIKLPTKFEGEDKRINQQFNYSVDQAFKYKQKKDYLIGQIIRHNYLHTNYKDYFGKIVTVAGWVRSARKQGGGNLCFIDLSDGTFPKTIQIVASNQLKNWDEIIKIKTAYSIRVRGLVIKSQGQGQGFQITVKEQGNYVKIVGICQDKKYPLAAKYHKPQTLRQILHLRPRTSFISAITRIKNNLSFATHLFFQNNGFLYIQTPIITTSDCEGAGEMFQVTNILPESKDIKQIKTRNGKIEYSKDFFKKPAFLTVSGQLAVQTYCCSMSNVYTFGPTFRAQVSHTPRHMSQFWMIEPQMAFADLYDIMQCAQNYIIFCVQYIIDNNLQDIKYLQKAKIKQGLLDYLTSLIKSPFAKCSYNQAIEILTKCVQKGVQFQNEIYWGCDLASQHQKYLCGVIFKKPTIVYNYPIKIKAFYMRQNEDKKTVASFDILAPQVGQIVGGAQRQERENILTQKIKDLGMQISSYDWYLQLRKYGTVPHAGFGLGFERLVMMCSGVDNIRDVSCFPRYPGYAEF